MHPEWRAALIVERRLAAVGAVYGLGARRGVTRHHPIARTVAYGRLVYAASSAGGLSAFRILPSPPHDRPGRQGAMIAARLHVLVPRRPHRATTV